MNYWEVHGILFLLGIALFPRITLLLATSVPFGILAWIGWVLCPHLLVAIIATSYYWHTNPILCIVAWVVALSGTAGEGKVVSAGVAWVVALSGTAGEGKVVSAGSRRMKSR
ncbi:MAG: hypothetical protein NTY66_00505 [Candidatus Vogelbacteria bacterium]|nr:hypothetical protein [Candidatus Vogelbacteria bacterium]